MTLDTSKKYVFAGDVYEWTRTGALWQTTGGRHWTPYSFQFFADKGLVTEVKEPRRFELEVTMDSDGLTVHPHCNAYIGDIIREVVTGRADRSTEIANTRWKIIGEEVL